MSINSIQSSCSDKLHFSGSLITAAQGDSDSTTSQITLDNAILVIRQDSISISSSAIMINFSEKYGATQSKKSDISNLYEAQSCIRHLLSYIQSDASQVLNTLRVPYSSAVLKLARENM